MYQVRIHGRGGRGVVTAAELLSVPAFLAGRDARAFPFGSERTGAPVVTFCRIDDRPIRLREPILAPDALIVQDPTLHAGSGKLVLEHMELDDTGFPQQTGELEELEADSLALALGQETDVSLLDGVPAIEVADGVLQVDERMMIGRPGIFAGGDMVPAERTLTVGIGHGKQAARCVDSWLRRADYEHPPHPPLVAFDELNPWYYPDAPRTVRPQLELVRRRSTFDEVVGGLDQSTAKFEARRCLSCGNCFACDNCFGVCPDNAVVKLDDLGPYCYELDPDFCKGCGLCAEECPCGAIEMEPEQI